jgi:hypothetical protein
MIFARSPYPRERRNSMLRFIVGVFMVLHGLVHLLYFAHSQRLIELRPEMVWPEGSWAFSKLLGNEATRSLASISYVLAAIGFVAGGIGILAGQAWWHRVVVGSAAFSAAIIILFWDGQLQRMNDKGLIGLLINIAILVALLVLRWPSVGF